MKQVIIVRKDLKMRCGKMIGQGCHASRRAIEITKIRKPENIQKWVEENNEVKIVLKINSDKELLDIISSCLTDDIPVGIVEDEGKTQIAPNTLTACAIGPDEDEIVNKVVEDLKLL